MCIHIYIKKYIYIDIHTNILSGFHQLQRRSWENVDDNYFLSQNPRTELLEPLLWEDPLVSPTKAILYVDRSNGVTSSGDLSILGFIVRLYIRKAWCFILCLSLCVLLGAVLTHPSRQWFKGFAVWAPHSG